MAMEEKQRDLAVVIDHLNTMENKEGSEKQKLQKALSSRLRNELRMMEIETMRKHILECPDLPKDSPAIKAALEAVEEAQRMIESNEVGDEEDSPSMIISPTAGGDNNSEASQSPRSISPVAPEAAINVSPGLSITNKSKSKPTKVTTSSGKATTNIFSFIGIILRMAFLDLPYISTFLLMVTLYCGQYTYVTYIEPTMDALLWDESRMQNEHTYYTRKCDRSDISTLNPDDFIIDPETQTPHEAAEITYKHGMSIFPNILTPETAAAMRKYVIERNKALNDDDAIPLISQNQRWSFPIGGADDPSIPPVLREIATHVMFQSSLNLLLGDDPAMVEFTAITSAYGAGDQHWHADNDFTASMMHYAKSFVSMYSLFIPLQDTTTAMGATSACPGTHKCGNEDGIADLCDELDFQVSDTRGRLAKSEEDHVWKSGDGYLFNLNVYHRGPGHTDPKGQERVMLIMTISPRPKTTMFDRRQISLGTSYSSKWDSWGLTMSDLVDVEKAYSFPRKILRLLGIYKTGKWGWDYVTVACSRIVNDQMGFNFEDLELFVKKARKNNELFNFLFGHIPDEEDTSLTGWREYLRESLKRGTMLTSALFGVCFLLYVGIGTIITRGKTTYLVRAIKMSSLIGIGTLIMLYLQQRTPWGRDIKAGKHMTPLFMGSDKFTSTSGAGTSTTHPTKFDVLIATRLDDPYLAHHNLFLNQQIGNPTMQSMIQDYSGDAPAMIRKLTGGIILSKIEKMGGRFLQQDANGDWSTLSSTQAATFVEKSMNVENNPIKKKIHRSILYQISNCRHGRMRTSVLSTKHALEYLIHLDDLLFAPPKMSTVRTLKGASFITFKIPSLPSLRQKPLGHEQKKTTKTDKKELKAGDIIESWFAEDGWFRGKVRHMNRDGTAQVIFDDGDFIDRQRLEETRHFTNFVAGDDVITTYDGTEGSIISISALGSVEIETVDGNIVSDIDISELRHLS